MGGWLSLAISSHPVTPTNFHPLTSQRGLCHTSAACPRGEELRAQKCSG